MVLRLGTGRAPRVESYDRCNGGRSPGVWRSGNPDSGAGCGDRPLNDAGAVRREAERSEDLLYDQTRSRYDAREWSRWEMWAMSHGHSPLPADPASISEYIMGLLMLGAPATGARAVLASIRWRHQKMGGRLLPADDRIPATLARLPDGERITVDDAADLVAATSEGRVYRVGMGTRREKHSRTRLRATLDVVIIGLGWETLATATEIAGLEWSNVDVPGSRVWYEDRGGWCPVSKGLSRRLDLLSELRGTAASVVGLSPASIRRRVKEAADYAGYGTGWSLRRVRTSAVWAIAARGGSLADLISPGGSLYGMREAGTGRALVAHIENSPIPLD